MTVLTKFKEPFHAEVKKAVSRAVSITWEGCHKIYVCTSEAAHEQQIGYGYDMERVDTEGNVPDGTPAVARLLEWFESSCGLRFIQEISGDGSRNADFRDVIGQCDYNEDEEDEDDE